MSYNNHFQNHKWYQQTNNNFLPCKKCAEAPELVFEPRSNKYVFICKCGITNISTVFIVNVNMREYYSIIWNTRQLKMPDYLK